MERPSDENLLNIRQIVDEAKCYQEVESQAISYTAGVPPVVAAILIAKGIWDIKTMVNVEELDPDPFLDLLNKIGLPTAVRTDEPSLELSMVQDTFSFT